MADGSIRIETSIDNKDAIKSLEELEKRAKQSEDEMSETQFVTMQQQLAKLKEQMIEQQEELTEQLDLYSQVQDGIANEEQRINKYIAERKELQSELNSLQEDLAIHDKLLGGLEKGSQEYLDQLKIVNDIKKEEKELQQELENKKYHIQDAQNLLEKDKDLLREINAEIDKGNKSWEQMEMKLEKITARLQDIENRSRAKALKEEERATRQAEQAERQRAIEAEKSAQATRNAIGRNISSIRRYAFSVLSLRSAYSIVSQASRRWLNSENAGAQQVKANIEAVSTAFSNLLAPAIQAVANVLTYIMSLINAFTKVFFGIDLMAQSVNKSTKGIGGGLNKASKGAKKLGKEMRRTLAPFDEVQKLTKDTSDNLGGGAGGGGGGGGAGGIQTVTPKLDTSLFEKSMKRLRELLDPFITTLQSIDLQPLTDAFNTLGQSVKRTGELIGMSFINILNNTMGPFIKLMAEEIVPRALLAISSVLDAINRQLEWILPEFVEPFFHWFMMELVPTALNVIISAFELLAPVIDTVGEALRITYHDVWKPFGEWVGGILIDILDGLAEALQEIGFELDEDNESVVSTLVSMMKMGSYILILIGVYKTLTGLVGVATTAFGVFKGLLGGVATAGRILAGVIKVITGTIAGKIAILAVLSTMILGVVADFEGFKEDVMAVVNNVKGILKGLTNFIGGVFTADWKRVWKGLVQIFSNIIGGIANIFKVPINALISGINVFIRGLNNIQIPKWVPGVGGRGFNIRPLTRLSEGGIIARPQMILAGEGGGREIVAPLDRNTGWIDELAEKINEASGTQIIRLEVDGKTLAEVVNNSNSRMNFRTNGGGVL